MKIFLIMLHLLIWIPTFPRNTNSVQYAVELKEFASIINAEAAGEDFIGKLMVGSTILNRTQHSEFMGSVGSVVQEEKQFCGYESELYHPTQESMTAAFFLLSNGPITDALFFMHPDGNKKWLRYMRKNYKFIKKHGNHLFFK